jgi:hypothetical protein
MSKFGDGSLGDIRSINTTKMQGRSISSAVKWKAGLSKKHIAWKVSLEIAALH